MIAGVNALPLPIPNADTHVSLYKILGFPLTSREKLYHLPCEPSARKLDGFGFWVISLLEEAADRMPQILDHRFRLAPLSIKADEEALTGPAEVTDNALKTKPFSYDRKAVETILSYLSQHSAQPIAQAASWMANEVSSVFKCGS